MKTSKINSFINKVNNSRNSGAREFKMPIEDALGVVLELTMIITDNHLISFDDLKEALLNSKLNSEPTKKITGGTF